MKIIISQSEAMKKKVWDDIIVMFGLEEEDEAWDNEQFILTKRAGKRARADQIEIAAARDCGFFLLFNKFKKEGA
ncbi:hypothetical protein [Paenibacillus faecalis]|uniref:hypothetical protein n=1 Tax=Paenibacillus faecalis TaxID=2079532 RepID=UPI0018F87145|nr:hypothetical protein [Paenibacillus faecalis]